MTFYEVLQAAFNFSIPVHVSFYARGASQVGNVTGVPSRVSVMGVTIGGVYVPFKDVQVVVARGGVHVERNYFSSGNREVVIPWSELSSSFCLWVRRAYS